MRLQTGPVPPISASLLCMLALLVASVLATAPARAQKPDGCSTASETESRSQTTVDSSTVELDIEKRGGTSLTQAKASLVVVPGTAESGGAKLSLLTVSESPRSAFDADRLSLVFADGKRETQDLKQVVDENEEGAAVRLHWVDLSAERLRRIAGSKALRLEGGGAVFDLSGSSIPAQAQAVLDTR
ncbi:hypothetical protein [Salinibacter grassmerensis]|uniref:hypothetical protein n=1 Tax=Salinibacter grassmerensis TaxID=3040353 RepID=UPI0021E81E1B|nr:hypothetical protein [Salinibacter grassmerensis]